MASWTPSCREHANGKRCLACEICLRQVQARSVWWRVGRGGSWISCRRWAGSPRVVPRTALVGYGAASTNGRQRLSPANSRVPPGVRPLDVLVTSLVINRSY